ncbi:terminase gpA endonuclease subunit [Sandarakinorhabdus sp.]|uniref:terminase gpA endonuclease subunit n=1 Tax=Sandarakinorhabdus sp. TaxID=1916663 RepID=UPI00286E82E2|nr:terminase gpA endonuclease subunit [Sandarakinorhabdus sp.]
MLHEAASFRHPPYADADALVADAIAAALRPPPPVDLVAWTSRNIIFGQNDPFPGPYDFDKFPFFRRLLAVCGPEDPARTITFRKSAQIGGTVVGDAFLLGLLDLSPALSMCVHPTLPQGRAWVNNKVKTKVRASVGLQAILSFDNPKDAKATELLFERIDARGGVIVTGANSAASLSQHTVKYQHQDDLSKWQNNDAGDPETQADSRSQAFEDAKVLKTGTPMEQGNCRVTSAFEAGSQEHYHVPCPHCGHVQALEWPNLQANIDAALAADTPATDGAFFTCASGNGCVIEEKHRSWMVDPANGAAWVAHNTAAPATRLSFHLWTVYAPLMSWSRVAEAYVTAKGDQAKDRAFLNDVCGIAVQTAGEAPDYNVLHERGSAAGIDRARVAPGYYYLFAGADVQANRVEIGIWAFGPDLRRHPVDHIVIAGSIAGAEEADVKAELDKLMARSWPDAWGKPVTLTALAIDVGYERQKVLDWVKRHPPSRVTPVVGSKNDHAAVIGAVQTKETLAGGKRRRAERIVYEVGAAQLKAFLYGDLRKTDPMTRAAVALVRGFSLDWYEQLTAEVRLEVEDKRHRKAWRWDVLKGRRNEVLDCAVYAHWLAELRGWKRITAEQWQTVAANMDGPGRDTQGALFSDALPDQVAAAAPGPAAVQQNETPPASSAPRRAESDADDYWNRFS